jgi:hypothetical protein
LKLNHLDVLSDPPPSHKKNESIDIKRYLKILGKLTFQSGPKNSMCFVTASVPFENCSFTTGCEAAAPTMVAVATNDITKI